MEKEEIKIVEKARFNCAYNENAQNIAIALARAGRFIQLVNENNTLTVVVYERE